MPVGLEKAPKTLPKAAQRLWVDTFNGVFDECDGGTKQCDERAARVAWANVKKKYRKGKKGIWVKMATKSEQPDMRIIEDDGLIVRAEFVISKASLADDVMRWACTASDTSEDRAKESTTLTLFQDWIDRIQNNTIVPWLPEPPSMPFLGLSHYPGLGGYGEIGPTLKMYIDGATFKAAGQFYDDESHPLGRPAFEAIRSEKALIKKSGQEPDNPIRISAAWYDVCHSHGDFIFTRRSLTDKCPLCRAGQTEGKRYLKGQINHFALTRVPMNPRTSINILTEKSDMVTRKQDALSVLGDESEELVEGLDQRARLVGKSEAGEDDNDPILVIMSGTFGKRMKEERGKKKMTYKALAEAAGVEVDIIKALEAGDEVETSQAALKKLAKAVGMKDDEVSSLLGDDDDDEEPRARKSEADEEPEIETAEADDDEAELVEASEADDDEDSPEAQKGHGMVMDTGMAMAMRPFGGATTLGTAQEWLESQKQKAEVASNFDMYMAVLKNIDSDSEIPDGKKAAKKAAVTRELADRIDTLKSAVADAYLISPIEQSEADEYDFEDDDFEGLFTSEDDGYTEASEVDEEADSTLEGVNTMSDDTPTQVPEAISGLAEVYQGVMADKSLTKEERAAKIQEAMTAFAQKAQAEIDHEELTPAQEQAQIIAEAVKAAVAPLYQEISLLKEKSAAQSQAPAQPQNLTDMSYTQEPVLTPPPSMADLTAPTQKSAAAPVEAGVVSAGGQMPVSPYTGKPSSLRAALAQTVQ